MIVVKLGGTSLGTPARIDAAVARIRATPRPVVVVSALGDGTDRLVEAVRLAPRDFPGAERLLAAVCARAEAPVCAGTRAHLAAIAAGEDRTADVLALGERLAARLVAGRLGGVAVDAREWLVTDDAGVPVSNRFAALRDLDRIPVVTGFVGATATGRTTLLGRGGSDWTATLVAAAVDADEVQIWTDVSGVLTADPRVVPDAEPIPELTFDEARALAEAGANVLHPRTLEPVQGRIAVVVKNSLRPADPGTRIGRAGGGVSVTARVEGALTRVAVVGAGVVRVTDAARRALAAFGAPLVACSAIEVAGFVPAVLADAAVRAVHAAVHPRVDVVVLGAGRVGGALLPLLDRPDVRVRAVGTRRWHEVAGDRRPGPLADPLAPLDGAARPVLVDCTAADGHEGLYARAVARGVAVVTANKRPLCASDAHALFHADVRAETTVGAALPVLSTVRDRLRAGDRIVRVEGVLSGTLAFVCARLAAGDGWGVAIRRAMALGLTEPRPQDDLGGEDVARKALILARACGRHVHRADVSVTPLLPPAVLAEPDVARFLARADRVPVPRRPVQVLATIDDRGVRVAAARVDPDHPAAAVAPGEAVVAVWTAHFGDRPLVVRGAGAGARVTASGLLADILRDLPPNRPRRANAPDRPPSTVHPQSTAPAGTPSAFGAGRSADREQPGACVVH